MTAITDHVGIPSHHGQGLRTTRTVDAFLAILGFGRTLRG